MTARSRKAPAAGKAKLAEYRKKRDFSKTGEPSGEAGSPTAGELRFVIQKHEASRLHFDLRLELDGVMKSWAVPKGPSTDPSVKRLAMEVEDHPVDYNTFEGTIPQGEYGGGTVMLWDRGTYAADSALPGDSEAALRAGYEKGDLKVKFFGERMRGSYALVRMKFSRDKSPSAKPQWLFIKHRDEFADEADIVATNTTSITTDRSMEEIATGNSKVWRSNQARDDKKATEVGRESKSMQKGESTADDSSRKSMKKPAKRSTARKRIYAERTLVSGTTAAKPAGEARRAKAYPTATITARLDEIQKTGSGRLEISKSAGLDVTNLGKIFFPKKKLTKGDLMRYYTQVAPMVLPVMADRPLVLKRFPNGVEGQSFFQQNAGENPPAGVRVETIETQGGSTNLRIVGGDLLTLLYTVQLGSVSVDPWHARVKSLDHADYSILDLDPGPRAPFKRVIEVAKWVQETMEELGLHGALKTSGSTGLHIYLPLPPETPNEAATLVAQIVATRVAEAHPKVATIERSVKARGGTTVYVDYLQNIIGKTVAAAYSARANADAMVSTPLEWDELTKDLDPGEFTIATAPARFAKVGDLWAAQLRKKNSLRALV